MDKIVHSILIDPSTCSISVVRINPDDTFGSAYRHIGCEVIEPAKRLPNGDVLFVDEEALISNRDSGAFMFAGQVFKGRGLLVNEHPETEMWTAPHSPVIELIRMIQFPPSEGVPSFTTADILAAVAGGQFRHMKDTDYDAFADCPAGSLICWDMRGWVVIVCPGDTVREGAISAHAYKFNDPEEPSMAGVADLAYELTREGWEAL